MALDNLKQLTADTDTAIPINGGASSVKTANHNPHEKRIISTVGRMVGFPFVAKRSPVDNAVELGCFYWDGNAMNTDIPFDLIVSYKTMDGNRLDRILGICEEGTIIHFKDFLGRSTTLELVSWSIDKEAITMTVKGFAENLDYAYQIAEEELCMIEFVPVNGAEGGGTVSPFDGVDIDLFWGAKGFATETEPFEGDEYFKEVETKVPLSTVDHLMTIATRVNYLGVKISNFTSIEDLDPVFIIERYKKPTTAKKNDGRIVSVPAGFKKQETNFFRYKDIVSNNVETLPRPCVIPITGESEFYDIYAENYYDKYAVSKPRVNKNHVTRNDIKMELNSGETIPVISDDEVVTSGFPFLVKKGFVHLRIRLGITVDGEQVVSKPLVRFKIVNKTDWDRVTFFPAGSDNAVYKSLISYHFE